MHKCRGEKKALQQILTTMKELGYAGGKVRIAHSYNPEAAEKLRDLIYSEFPESDIAIRFNRGLCCYYAEEGGILIGFEG
jgi:fatty acid-binding protein DegV